MSDQPTEQPRVSIPAHVVFRSFVAETVMLNLNTGRYHGLNRTAGRMLEVLRDEPSTSRAAALLAEEFGQPVPVIEHDLLALCERLAERGLIEYEP